MIRSILCGLAALVFLCAFVTFAEFSGACIASEGDASFPDAATAVAGAMRLVFLGLGPLAAGCVDWKWLGERAARADR